MSLKPSDLLFAVGGQIAQRYGTLYRRTRGADRGGEAHRGTFSRASAAWTRHQDGLCRPVPDDRHRIAWFDLDGDGVNETPAYLGEPSVTHDLDDPSELEDSASPWGGNAGFTISARPSIISGKTAYQHQNGGGGPAIARIQTDGVLSAADSVWGYFENVDAERTALSIFDQDLATHLHIANLVWATGETETQQGSGAAFVRQEAVAGPNGGPVYWLGCNAAGTDGNVKQIFVFPTGVTTNTETVIIHHIQSEARAQPTTTPIPEGAGVVRAADALDYPYYGPPTGIQIYSKFLDLGGWLVASGRVWEMGDAAGGVRVVGTGTIYQVVVDMGATTVSAGPVVSLAYGDLVEILVTVRATSADCEVAINGAVVGKETTGVYTAFTMAPTLQIGHSGSGALAGAQAHLAHLGARGVTATMQDFRNVVRIGVLAP
jgi:hypothetical protein